MTLPERSASTHGQRKRLALGDLRPACQGPVALVGTSCYTYPRGKYGGQCVAPPIVVIFQIPIREDDDKGSGKLHPPFRWRALHDALYTNFGGWTRGGTVQGVWRDPEKNRPVHDKSRTYEVDVPEERLDEIKGLLRRACLTFVQKCIRVKIDGKALYLSEEPHDESL